MDYHQGDNPVFMYTILRSLPEYNPGKCIISQATSREQTTGLWRYESLFIVNTDFYIYIHKYVAVARLDHILHNIMW